MSQTMRPIGYYVHHHGDGHRQRALAIAAHGPDRFTLIGTGLAGRVNAISNLSLPDDRINESGEFDGNDEEQRRPSSLHYAPLHHEDIRTRMAAIAQWIANERPALMVVDVSVEVAMLARLCSTPVAYVRLGGHRDDPPHLDAFRAASLLISPFAELIDDPQTVNWIKEKTVYAPGIVLRRVASAPRPRSVLVVCGHGGSTISRSRLNEAARSTPNWHWRVIGLTSDKKFLPSNLAFAGWTENPESEIARAEVVIGAAGDGLVSAVLAARRPFVCIPEPRPFNEQRQKAAALQRLGAAIVLDHWPPSERWNAIFASAVKINDAQAALDDPEGAAKLASKLIEFANLQ